MTMREQLAEWYLDFVNNFISVEGFAEYYEISTDEANNIINLGKKFHFQKIEES